MPSAQADPSPGSGRERALPVEHASACSDAATVLAGYSFFEKMWNEFIRRVLGAIFQPAAGCWPDDDVGCIKGGDYQRPGNEHCCQVFAGFPAQYKKVLYRFQVHRISRLKRGFGENRIGRIFR